MKNKEKIVYIISISILFIVVVFLFLRVIHLEKQAELNIISKTFASEHTGMYDIVDYDCNNYTADYIQFLKSYNYTAIRLEVDLANSQRHALACVLIEPQSGEFIKNEKLGETKIELIWSPYGCAS